MAFERQEPALIILDLMLPKKDGLEVAKEIRKESQVPIIMLTAKTEEADRVTGLEIGADDYVTKPFSLRELAARIKAVLHRSEGDLGKQDRINNSLPHRRHLQGRREVLPEKGYKSG